MVDGANNDHPFYPEHSPNPSFLTQFQPVISNGAQRNEKSMSLLFSNLSLNKDLSLPLEMTDAVVKGY